LINQPPRPILEATGANFRNPLCSKFRFQPNMSDTIRENEVQPVAVVESQPAVVDTPMAATTETESKPEAVKTTADTTTAAEQTDKAQNGAANSLAPMLKTTAQINRENIKANRKFDPSTLEITDDPVKIRTQV